MFGRERNEACAEERIGTRRINLDRFFALWCSCRIKREANRQTFRAADPVLLHQAHFFRPTLETIECFIQIIRERRKS